jgi:hypothetical protein
MEIGNLTMSPYGIFGLALLAVLVSTILALTVTTPRRRRSGRVASGEYDHLYDAKTAAARSNISFEKIKSDEPPVRTFGKRIMPERAVEPATAGDGYHFVRDSGDK